MQRRALQVADLEALFALLMEQNGSRKEHSLAGILNGFLYYLRTLYGNPANKSQSRINLFRERLGHLLAHDQRFNSKCDVLVVSTLLTDIKDQGAFLKDCIAEREIKDLLGRLDTMPAPADVSIIDHSFFSDLMAKRSWVAKEMVTELARKTVEVPEQEAAESKTEQEKEPALPAESWRNSAESLLETAYNNYAAGNYTATDCITKARENLERIPEKQFHDEERIAICKQLLELFVLKAWIKGLATTAVMTEYHFRLVQTLKKVADGLRKTEEYDKATTFYREAIHTCYKLDCSEKNINVCGLLLFNLAKSYHEEGSKRRAQSEFDKAILLYTQAMDEFGTIQRWVNTPMVEVLKSRVSKSSDEVLRDIAIVHCLRARRAKAANTSDDVDNLSAALRALNFIEEPDNDDRQNIKKIQQDIKEIQTVLQSCMRNTLHKRL